MTDGGKRETREQVVLGKGGSCTPYAMASDGAIAATSSLCTLHQTVKASSGVLSPIIIVIQLYYSYHRSHTNILSNLIRHLLLLCWVVLCELQTDTVDAMSLVSRRWIPFSLEHMSQMPSAVAAHNLRPLHPESAICMPRHRTWHGVKESRPAAARLEFVVCFVKRRLAADTGVDA